LANEYPHSIVREHPVPYAEERRVPIVHPCICERYDAHIWLGEREMQRNGEGCAREEQGDGGEVLGVDGVCEEGAEGAGVAEEGIADVLEEAECGVGGRGGEVEGGGGEVDGED
jgi:hypothetical protein